MMLGAALEVAELGPKSWYEQAHEEDPRVEKGLKPGRRLTLTPLDSNQALRLNSQTPA